ncbi:hypothetical protein [Streptomyces californicus]|uniref:hypothetical protein n=1 Tax=Streptomyces californicus TaxID=67351 RepID=UPI00296E8263|nr:hypothetical protein [Streptomyces californicus]MDW4913729.1 hypothetical protein [Streptomyces californicus]
MTIKPIETRYAGHRFRSRLEARWAVFFDTLDIAWQYEPEGFVLPVAGAEPQPYLPDFLLPDCGTWIEVKGAEEDLDHKLMTAAAHHLPTSNRRTHSSPRILILGPLPEAPERGDWAWMGLDGVEDLEGNPIIIDSWYGFGGYEKDSGPMSLTETSCATPYFGGDEPWLRPARDTTVPCLAAGAYTAARSARFEHGQSGA